jgi:hypothetical protein
LESSRVALSSKRFALESSRVILSSKRFVVKSSRAAAVCWDYDTSAKGARAARPRVPSQATRGRAARAPVQCGVLQRSHYVFDKLNGWRRGVLPAGCLENWPTGRRRSQAVCQRHNRTFQASGLCHRPKWPPRPRPSEFRLPNSVLRFPSSGFRPPVSALRFPPSGFRPPSSAFRPRSVLRQRQNPVHGDAHSKVFSNCQQKLGLLKVWIICHLSRCQPGVSGRRRQPPRRERRQIRGAGA